MHMVFNGTGDEALARCVMCEISVLSEERCEFGKLEDWETTAEDPGMSDLAPVRDGGRSSSESLESIVDAITTVERIGPSGFPKVDFVFGLGNKPFSSACTFTFVAFFLPTLFSRFFSLTHSNSLTRAASTIWPIDAGIPIRKCFKGSDRTLPSLAPSSPSSSPSAHSSLTIGGRIPTMPSSQNRTNLSGTTSRRYSNIPSVDA